MSDTILIFCAVAGLLASVLGIRALWRGSIDYLPTLGWCLLIVFPFALEFPLFYQGTRDLHGWAVFLFLGVIFITDHLAARRNAMRDAQERPPLSPLVIHAGYGMAVAYIAVTLFHLATAQTIPFANLFFHGTEKYIVDAQRNDFSRGYDFIPGLRYVFTLAMSLLGMPAVIILTRAKKYWLAGLLFLWILVYCVTGTAKGPFILALLMAGTSGIYFSHGRTQRLLARGALILSALVLVSFAAVLLNPHMQQTVFSDLRAKYADHKILRDDRTMLLGDYEREIKNRRDSSHCGSMLCHSANYLTYRVLLTPVEVSARWYEYFDLYPVADMSVGRLINDTRSGKKIHPAQAVGLWAFHEPYPVEYSDTAFAYPSLDADAYGRYGLTGLMIAACFYAALRLSALWFSDRASLTQGIYYAIMIDLFTLLPANASVQAMLVAHGVAPIMLVMSGMYIWRRSQRLRITSA